MSVTIASFTFDYSRPGGTCTIKWYADSDFLDPDGVYHPAQAAGGSDYLKSVTCSVASNAATAPTFTLPATWDEASGARSSVTAVVFDSAGRKVGAYLVSNFRIPTLPATTTWGALLDYNTNAAEIRDTSTYTKTQTNYQIEQALLAGNIATTTTPGRALLSANPTDPLTPRVIEENDPLLNALSATGVFDANEYGAVPYASYAAAAAGTDSAAAFEEAIADAVTWSQTNGRSVEVVYDPGVYLWARAPVTTNNAYAQVPLPRVTLGAARVHLTLRPKSGGGHTIPFQGSGPGAAAVFYSTLTGQSYGGSGWPSMLGGPDTVNGVTTTSWSWMTLHIKGTAFHQPANPSLCCVNATLLIRCTLEDVRFTAGEPSGFPAVYTEPTNPTGVACLQPMGGTDGMSYRGLCEAAGLYAGPSVSELTDVAGQLFVYQCKVGLNLLPTGSYHSPVVEHAIVAKCPYVLASVDPATGVVGSTASTTASNYHFHLKILHLDIEEDASTSEWYRHKYHVYDPNIALAGYIGYERVIYPTGSTRGPLTMSGGGYLETKDLATPPPQRVIWQDTFTHTFAQEGNALSGRTPEKTAGGGNWAVWTAAADFKLVNNRLKADTTGTHQVRAGLGSGNYNGTFEFVASVASGGIVGCVVGRVDDSNYIYVRALHTGTLLKLHEVVAGVDTEQVSVSFSDIVAGKDLLYEVIKDGNRIRVRADGGELIDWPLSAGAIAAGLGTGTGVGLLVSSGQNSTIGAARFLR